MRTMILGGGLAGLTAAATLEGDVLVLEAEETAGGLCRSFSFAGRQCDYGPHILFSKNKAALDFLLSLSDTEQRRRSNKIFHKGRLVKYPFENQLSALDPEERDYCLSEFLKNPYSAYPAENMLQFFLKTFGEGITRTYLQPYNEKIWKLDPSFMDTQMMERIPRPPEEDIIRSARGEETEGYLHQLYFNYPKNGGMASLIDGLARRCGERVRIKTGAKALSLRKNGDVWIAETASGTFEADRVVSTIPIHELSKIYSGLPQAMTDKLLCNSIHLAMLHVKENRLGDNYALYFADRNTIFHRLSRPAFLGPAYAPEKGDTVMAEITFRHGSALADVPPENVLRRTEEDFIRLGFADRDGIISSEIRTAPYAYVIYDLDHRLNTDAALSLLREQGVYSCGRFAEFEYLNTDAVVARALKLTTELNDNA